MHNEQSKNNNNPIFTPTDFYNELQSLPLKFEKTDTQQDCNEFLLKLFNIIEKPSILSEVFEFNIKRVTQCENCRSSRTSDEPQNILECPVPEKNGELSDCLNIYFKEEYLTGNTAYDCHSCQSKQNAKTKMGINSLPKVLLISLKRFKANGLEKSHFAVKYPEKLCIKQWLSEDCSFDITEEKEIYQLFAIVVHDSNKMTTGHYICYFKDEFTNIWYKADDKFVTKTDSALDMEKSVYLLCYVRSDVTESIKKISVSAINSIDNQHIIITDKKLLNDLEKQVQFRFCENVYPEQRRFSKADAFGKLGSNE
ncbi:unnamed protein product [Rotaria sp. Silwood1]|nr:unnamed protein product [Rotaria sp. Silwood1]